MYISPGNSYAVNITRAKLLTDLNANSYRITLLAAPTTSGDAIRQTSDNKITEANLKAAVDEMHSHPSTPLYNLAEDASPELGGTLYANDKKILANSGYGIVINAGGAGHAPVANTLYLEATGGIVISAPEIWMEHTNFSGSGAKMWGNTLTALGKPTALYDAMRRTAKINEDDLESAMDAANGAIPKSIINGVGDIIYGYGSPPVPTKLVKGSNDYILKVKSDGSGLEWVENWAVSHTLSGHAQANTYVPFGGQQANNMVLHTVADATARNALTAVKGKVCYQSDEKAVYVCTDT